MKKISKKTLVYGVIILLVVVLGMFAYSSSKKTVSPSYTTVARENLVQEVSVSGTVKATEAVELAFEKNGRIKTINADVGDWVPKGSVLLSIDNGVEISSVEDAEAKLTAKKAQYDDLKNGSRPEEIKLKETELAKATSDLVTAYSAVPNVIGDAFNKADNAVRRQADVLFSNPLSANPQLNFNSGNQQLVFDAQIGRYDAEQTLLNFKKLTQEKIVDESDNEKKLAEVKKFLTAINDFLIKTSVALNSALNISESTLATNKDLIGTARTNINTALTSVTDQLQTIASKKILVETAESDLALTIAGETPEALAVALADVQSAEANVENAKALLSKTYIISPISGIVTKQDGKVGQIAGGNSIIVAVMSDNFKIEAFIPEVDVAKISVGNQATITLDAYGNGVIFNAHLIKIDPAETIIDGVSTYKATLEFDTKDTRIRSGMTANITIISANREKALSIPQRAVYEKNSIKFVKKLYEDGSIKEQQVTVGIRGSNGNVEIIEGLNEGEKIVSSGK